MGVVIVKVTIEPSYTAGFAMWVRSQEDVKDVWWKWYATQQNAYMEAEQLGLAFALEIPQGFTLLVRRQIKESASIDPAELTNFGFREVPDGKTEQ
jgi:hypothetical protein